MALVNRALQPVAILSSGFALAILLTGTAVQSQEAAAPRLVWQAAVNTTPVTDDPDDPAVWVHPTEPSLSLVVATNKVAAPSGALVVFDLDGQVVQTIRGIDRPNNVDLRQGVQIGERTIDLVAVTERNRSALLLYSVAVATRRLTELGRLRVFAGETGDFAAPMGIALYKRPKDGALFAIVGRKSGPREGYLWQYRVSAGPEGMPTLSMVRRFGKFSGSGEIESIVVDDASGFVYYSDEGAGIRKYHADPDNPAAATELAMFGRAGYRGDREGLAIYPTGEHTGFLISTDQIDGRSRYLLYRREGSSANVNDHSKVVAVIESGADGTDGLEVVATPLGSRFPHGLLVAMNSGPKNFLYFAWEPINPINR